MEEPSFFPRSSEQMLVRSNGRIHFGLHEISEFQPNCFGGIGLMVESFRAVVQVAIGPSSRQECSIQAGSYWHPRIEAILDQWLQTRAHLPIRSLRVIESPLPHQGLGSGTQMACTVAASLLVTESSWSGKIAFSIEQLAELSQRGKRSNIGLCGFMQGGFIVDHGQPSPTKHASSESRTQRVVFPDWPVLILQDTRKFGDSGKDEMEMFERCSSSPNPNREAMIQLVQQELLPAIAALDWKKFDQALGSYGRWAGQLFEPAQGGVYRTPQIAHHVEVVKQLGLYGATQSSWGPTICAFAQDQEHASWCQSRLQSALPDVDVLVTKAANNAAKIEYL